MLEIRKITFLELEQDANFYALADEATNESAVLSGGKFNADTYKKIEDAGLLNTWAAYYNSVLIGFVFVICTHSPKTNAYMTFGEIIFVSAAFRKTGAGLQLKKLAEDFGEKLKTQGILFTAEVNGALDKLLSNPKSGYERVQHVYLKRFNNE